MSCTLKASQLYTGRCTHKTHWKKIEKIVFDHLKCNGISETFQSGFKSAHSTESALLRVLNDIYLSTDTGDSVVLVLLDLSAAFDTVEHSVI